MSACTFFGHRECCGLDAEVLRGAIEDLIGKGVDTFYVGNQGRFDSTVFTCLKQIKKVYPHICVCVVLAYLPQGEREEDMADSVSPEIEVHPQFALDRRSLWMIRLSDYCLCYISHSWGGAYQFARMAKNLGKTVINLGQSDI